jgi:hypothetical protein
MRETSSPLARSSVGCKKKSNGSATVSTHFWMLTLFGLSETLKGVKGDGQETKETNDQETHHAGSQKVRASESEAAVWYIPYILETSNRSWLDSRRR